MRLIRQVGEDEVIAQFLKAEFYYPEFNPYRRAAEDIVLTPDITNPAENALRRHLFLHKRRHLWRELPSDTQWYQVEIGPEDLNRIQLFPRGRWVFISPANLAAPEVARRIRSHTLPLFKSFKSKLISMHDSIGYGEDVGSLLMIGDYDGGSLRVIDGNHRITAALLGDPSVLPRLPVYCGLSHAMYRCCWYATTPGTLARYAGHRLQHALLPIPSYDPAAALLSPRSRPRVLTTALALFPPLWMLFVFTLAVYVIGTLMDPSNIAIHLVLLIVGLVLFFGVRDPGGALPPKPAECDSPDLDEAA